MKLSEMRQTLAAEGIQLSKSLGQNFLHDANQLSRIVRAAELSRADRVLEIGPGLGPLTQLLVEKAGQLLAIEKDQRLVDFLNRRFEGTPSLTLIHADALNYLRAERRDWSGWKLVSNLPYSVASPLLVELAKLPQPPDRLVVTLQFEVAQRLMAAAASEHYGILTLLIQLAYEPHGQFRIPSKCFFPPPDVDSTCLTLVRRKNPLLPDGYLVIFERLVKRGFSQRRKMMYKLLKSEWPARELDSAFAEVGLSPDIRAERVSLQQFVRLAKHLPAVDNSRQCHD
ncbi:MAG: 16S rRNA (adenine(1518)-N(6)/adenine(1519)-N(6))-dimethyltransferase RsmA [Verrucomicrobiales bacterium]|nr:16S rRNA (adenine(1518)-N(6)/adenine(1519)-N(6))-dimethyltransferase RsmA [Verrucomicrobiales bacterium]